MWPTEKFLSPIVCTFDSDERSLRKLDILVFSNPSILYVSGNITTLVDTVRVAVSNFQTWENLPLSRGSRPWVLSGSPSCGARPAIVSLPCCSSYDAPSICHPSSHPERTAAANGRQRKSTRTLERSYSLASRKTRCSTRIHLVSIAVEFGGSHAASGDIITEMMAHLLPRFLDHRLGFELLVGEGPGTWIEVSPRWGHRERYKRQAILYSRRVLGICCAEGESTMSTLV